ncbi:hypothetical protein [Larkinella arboricola]
MAKQEIKPPTPEELAEQKKEINEVFPPEPVQVAGGESSAG